MGHRKSNAVDQHRQVRKHLPHHYLLEVSLVPYPQINNDLIFKTSLCEIKTVYLFELLTLVV